MIIMFVLQCTLYKYDNWAVVGEHKYIVLLEGLVGQLIDIQVLLPSRKHGLTCPKHIIE